MWWAAPCGVLSQRGQVERGRVADVEAHLAHLVRHQLNQVRRVGGPELSAHVTDAPSVLAIYDARNFLLSIARFALSVTALMSAIMAAASQQQHC